MNDSILNQVSPNQQVNKLLESSNKPLILSTLFQNTFSINGKNKLIIKNNIPLISNIPSIILKNLKIIHPLQILIKDKLESIEKYGDSSNFLIILFHYLLKGSQKLLLKGIKPTLLIKYLDELKEECLLIIKNNSIKISNPKKMIEGVLKNDKLIELILESLLSLNIEINNEIGDIQIYKMNGSFNDSYIERGIVLQSIPVGTIKNLFKKENKSIYKTLILSCSLDISRTETKGTVLFENANQMLKFDSDEEEVIENIIKNLKADLIICENVSTKFLDLANIYNKMVLIVKSKYELIRLQKLFGGIISPQLRDFKEIEFGKIDSIKSSSDMTIIESSSIKIITIILKENIECNLDEKARLINKGIKILFKSIKNSNSLIMLKGAGLIELQVSKELIIEYENSKSEVAFLVKDSFLEINNIINNNKEIIDNNKEIYDDFESKYNAIRYAFELLEDVLLCEDYYMSKGN